MRAYYLGTELGSQNDPKNLLFVKTWVMRASNNYPDVKVIALFHPHLISAARQSPKAVHDGILELADNSPTGVTCVNVLQGFLKECLPPSSESFLKKKEEKSTLRSTFRCL